MSNGKTNRSGSVIAFILSGLTIVAAILIFFHRQTVVDTLTVWSYEPSSQVAALTTTTGFTDTGRFSFYATRPSVADQAEFNANCPRQEVGSPILGCYTSTDRIFIYDLQNQQLAGMEEVTATHEMLHSVWQRLDESEKARISAAVRSAYGRMNDTELKERMAYYERTEPGEFINELHSILGTEVRDLGDELGSYYARYFDRQKVLALHEQYDAVYTQLYGRADELFRQMDASSDDIESRSAAYDRSSDDLTTDIAQFNRKANNNEFASRAAFDAERAALVSRSNQLETDRQAVNAAIVAYNLLYDEYQQVASQIEVLNQSIDSFREIQSAPSI